MDKLTIRQWIAMFICIGVPAFLMYLNHDTTLFSVSIISYVVMAILEEWKRKPFTTFAPLVAYVAMIGYVSVKILMPGEVFYSGKTEVLVNIIMYGAVLLLAIPFLYVKRSLK